MYGRAKAMTERMVGEGGDDDANGWTDQGDHDEEDRQMGRGGYSKDHRGG